MQVKEVLTTESLDVGYLMHKGGGTAKFTYAAKTMAQALDTFAEVYGYRITLLELEPVAQDATKRLPDLPASTQALIERSQDDDIVTGLNLGSAVES